MPIYQDSHELYREKISDFLKTNITPYANKFDNDQRIPRSVFHDLAHMGCLSAIIPRAYGGQEMDYSMLGIMHEEFGKVLASLENILTVYGMVLRPLIKFGTKEQKEHWLSSITSGETIVAIALTEPEIGSDLASTQTQVTIVNNQYCLNGIKKYITLGQIADLFLVLAKQEDQFITLLIEKNTPGMSIIPIENMLGFRSNMLAEINFQNCLISKHCQLGVLGSGLAQVIACALDEGRYTTAWGSVGIGQACFELAHDYAHKRIQSKALLKDHQLVQKMLTEIIVNVKAGRELCFNAGQLRDQKDFSYIGETLVAKYFASKAAVLAAKRALEIFGAAGFSRESTIERFFRDAQAMELVEGTSQIHEMTIAKMCFP